MISAIVDIGSGSIGLASVLFEKNKAPAIRFCARKELRINDILEPKRLFSQSLSALSEVANEMQRQTSDAPSGIFCFLSSHLVIPKTKIINLNFDSPTLITDSIVEEALEREVVTEKIEAIAERRIMRTRLNGYEISKLGKKVANEVEVAVYLAESSPEVLKGIKNAVSDSFHGGQVEFCSFSFAYSSILRDLLQPDCDFVSIDAGSEITDISLIQNGIMSGSVSIPLGRNEIARELNGSGLAGTKWANAVRAVLDGFGFGQRPLGDVYLLADASSSPVFVKLLKDGSNLVVKEICVADFNKFCNNKDGTVADPFLTIATMFVNKLLN